MTIEIPNYSGQYDISASNETWTLADGLSVNSSFGNGINEASYRHDSIVNVNGSITALSSGSGGVVLQGAHSSVTVGGTGVIDAWHGLQLFGDDQSAVNDGTIMVAGMGMYSTHATNSLLNNGTIKAAAGAAGLVDGMVADGGNTVTNSATGEIDVTGNGLVVQSNGGDKTLVTNLGSVKGDNLGFYGWAGDDRLANRGTMDGDVQMNSGNDTFDGIGGVLMGAVYGGANNDRYIIDKSNYKLVEKANEGTDTVQSTASYTLGANFEHLILTGKANINGKGNSLGNELTGNAKANKLSGLAGADDLDGGKGNDILTGGGAADTFHFAKGYGKDTITDFGNGVDTIDLSDYGAISDFNDLMKHHLKVSGDDLIIHSGVDQLIIEDTKKSALDAGDFDF